MNTIKTAAHLRYTAIQMSHRSKAAHLASSLSCIDILTVLYEKILKINPRKRDQKRDRFILSKGHAAGALYATLAHKGFFNKNKLLTYATKGSLLEEHPNPKLNGIEAPTGSLGHGLPIACGMALSAKILNLNFKTFVLLGDGECNEGMVWEAILFSSHQKLDNLMAIIDYNKLQGFGSTKSILNLDPLKEKFESFGWNVLEVNGHDIKSIVNASRELLEKKNKPNLIIANTVKGKGADSMENKLESHYEVLDEKKYLDIIKNYK